MKSRPVRPYYLQPLHLTISDCLTLLRETSFRFYLVIKKQGYFFILYKEVPLF